MILFCWLFHWLFYWFYVAVKRGKFIGSDRFLCYGTQVKCNFKLVGMYSSITDAATGSSGTERGYKLFKHKTLFCFVICPSNTFKREK